MLTSLLWELLQDSVHTAAIKGVALTHIHNGILLSHKKNEIELFVMRWMDIEFVTQSEVSQKDKNKYHMLRHIYGI